MSKKLKDETRWLARLIAVYVFVFVVNGFIVNLSAVFSPSEDSALLVGPIVGLVLGLVIFWLACRLFVCSSLWNLLDFFVKEYPLLTYIQCRYFSVNHHIRSGLMGTVMMLLMVYPLPLMFHVFKDTWFFPVPKTVRDILFWPVKTFFDVSGFQYESRVLFFVMLLVYFAVAGFIAGGGISLIAGCLAGTPSDPEKPK